jgi:hypothetical protein
MAEKVEQAWADDVPASELIEPKRKKSKQEKRLLLKMDLAIVPLLACSFFIAYMASHFERSSNIANFKRIETILEMLGSWECKQTSSCRMSNSSTV